MGSNDAVFKRSFRDGLGATMVGFAASGFPVGIDVAPRCGCW
jgi:hypothetical protein